MTGPPLRTASALRVAVVIPCYNEAGRLDLDAFSRFLAPAPTVALQFVDDGSSDDTHALLLRLQAAFPERVAVLRLEQNQGKAEAVRRGMARALASGAEYAGYFDADLATPLEALDEFVRTLDAHPEIDLVMGARVALLGREIDRKPVRHYLGRLFATAASGVLGLPVYDTQCGAKLMRATPEMGALFAEPFRSRWIFDVELIARYLSRKSSRGLYELPLRRWVDVGESKVRPRDFVRAIGEMATLYGAYRLPRRGDRLLALLSAPFLRYVGAGGFGTALHYLTLALVVELFGAAPAHATVIGAIIGALVNYVLNYHVTFASELPHRATLPRFLIVAALSATLNGAGMWYATERHTLHYLTAQVLCTLGVLVFGYVINKLWTFRRPPQVAPHAVAARELTPQRARLADDPVCSEDSVS